MKKLLIGLLLFMFTSTIQAGGTASPVKIISFTPNDDNIMAYEMTLKHYDNVKGWKISEFKGCDEITVKGFYDYKRWKNYRRPMTAKIHRQSLSKLIIAMQKDKPIYFGTFGGGLVKKSKCVYESRGLFRGYAIYSVNGRI